MKPFTFLTATVSLLLAPALSRAVDPPSGPVTYETQIRPILKAHCFECHGEGKKLRGGLDLRLAHAMARGGDTGPALVPGKPAESLILQRIRAGEMPPGKTKLTQENIALVERWIAAGAGTARPEPKELPLGFSMSPEEAAFWAWQPIRRPAPPKVKNQHLVRTSVDAYLLAKLEEKGESFSPEAEPALLLRRVYFDLIGLPPTPEEVDRFIEDCGLANAKLPSEIRNSQSAVVPDSVWSKWVDRLLNDPRYGERWGRHWLDVTGYADSEGYTADPVRNSAWRYRDYLIRSFHADKPFDQFIQEQLAGDEMVKPPYEKLPPEELDKLIATGFLRMAADGTASPGVDVKIASNQNVADTIQIVSSTLLGVTLHCAQCHNHRYDPIPQVDYYRMRAVFEPALNPKSWRAPAAREVPLFPAEAQKKAADIEQEAAKIDQERLKKQTEFIEQTFQKQLAKLPKELHEPIRAARNLADAKRTPEQKKLLQAHPSTNVTAGSLYLYDSKAAKVLKDFADQAAKLRATKPTPDYIRALTEGSGPPPTTFLFERGDIEAPKDVVAPAHLTILESFSLGAIAPKDPALPTTGRRLAFARDLTSGKHPLTARVVMNRVWQHHFGKGIVGTPGDFGFLGERPTHPELLDWLASEFMRGGWRLKRMHKMIVTSTAYRQSSAHRPDLEKIDPENRLLGRMPLQRLEAEMLRDAILAVGGKLQAKLFGPPVPVTLDEVGQAVIGKDNRRSDGVPDGAIKGLEGDEFRRSVYVQVRRSLPLAVLDTFDGPAMSPNCEVRHASTVAPQALMLMNSKFIHEQAGFFAARVRREAPDVRAQVARAWKLAYATEPATADIERGATFVNQQTELFKTQKIAEPAAQALANYCQALLSSNRFLYLD
jgi:mono/diheme cytochrome c family protein